MRGVYINEKFNYVTDYDFFIEQSTKNKFFKSNNIYASWRINENQISTIHQKSKAEEIKFRVLDDSFFLKGISN